MQALLKDYPNLTIKAGSVHDITFQNGLAVQNAIQSSDGGSTNDSVGPKPSVAGIRLESGEVISCSQVVICTGTFLAGEIHIGRLSHSTPLRKVY
jgi:tRNA uridine 5-carboxymethylaminomethyl modification enzyme